MGRGQEFCDWNLFLLPDSRGRGAGGAAGGGGRGLGLGARAGGLGASRAGLELLAWDSVRPTSWVLRLRAGLNLVFGIGTWLR